MSATPKSLGYTFPAEFTRHEATWLSWPHKEASWPEKIHTIFPYYSQFIKELTKGELVRINSNCMPIHCSATSDEYA